MNSNLHFVEAIIHELPTIRRISLPGHSPGSLLWEPRFSPSRSNRAFFSYINSPRNCVRINATRVFEKNKGPMSFCACTASDSNLKVMDRNFMHCMGITRQKKKTLQKSSWYRFLKPPAVLAYCFPLWMGLIGCSLQSWDFVAKGDNPERKSWSSSLRIGRKASYRMGHFYQTFGNISFAIHTLHNHYSFNRIHFSKELPPTCCLRLITHDWASVSCSSTDKTWKVSAVSLSHSELVLSLRSEAWLKVLRYLKTYRIMPPINLPLYRYSWFDISSI